MGLADKVKAGVQKANEIADAVKNARISGKEFHEEIFFATGTGYYEKDIHKVLKPNPEYKSFAGTIVKNGHAGKKIYQYDCMDKSAKLIPEPKNQHDPNAVMVKIDGHLVGYIKREECSHIKDILKNGYVEYINAFVSGGKHKIVSLNKDVESLESGFKIRITIGYYK